MFDLKLYNNKKKIKIPKLGKFGVQQDRICKKMT